MSRRRLQPAAIEAPDSQGPGARGLDLIQAAPGERRGRERQIVQRWIDAFNARDLEGMLSCMSPVVAFQPVRLHGIERTYNGRDGITRWHGRLGRLHLDDRIEVRELTVPGTMTVLAVGRLGVEALDSWTPFWGVHTIDDGLIVAARHHRGDV